MFRFPKPLSISLCFSLLIALNSESLIARQIVKQQSPEAQKPEPDSETKKEKRARRAERKKQTAPTKEAPSDQPPTDGGAAEAEVVDVIADKQSKNGDIVLYEGYVNATQGEVRLQADRVTFNTVTHDMIAEGNVIFDQGADQRVTARRAEINVASKRGVFWDTTGFTNRTQTGDYVFFTAKRVEKT
ncbi:MAG TPA: hypothetical protein VN687_18635, partial [Blastocatellia bacterium]|nr:hypothetical protein [Blastocatellia bacterium]